VEVVLPEEMDHNRFDYEVDLLYPVKDFLKRNTYFNGAELTDVKIPTYLYDPPKTCNIYFEGKESEVNIGCFGKSKD